MRVSVIDNGLGIKKEDQAKMFSIFGTIKNVKKGINTNGIGLGLVICKLIVKKFNGKINFLSKVNKGTTFFFDFETEAIDLAALSFLEPQTIKIKAINSLKKMSTKKITQHGHILSQLEELEENKVGRIMIVDDEEFCLSSMKAIMQQTGFNMNKVDECITGLEAVNLIEKSAKYGVLYTLIFTDFNMP